MPAARLTPETINLIANIPAMQRALKAAAAIAAARCDGSPISQRVTRTYRYIRAWRPSVDLGLGDNAQGDVFSCVFAPVGVLLRGVVKDTFRANRTAATTLDSDIAGRPTPLPKALSAFLSRNDERVHCHTRTFYLWHTGRDGWCMPRRMRDHGDLYRQPLEQLRAVTGHLTDFKHWTVREYSGALRDADLEHFFALQPADAAVLQRIGAQRSLADLRSDFDEIGYPLAGGDA